MSDLAESLEPPVPEEEVAAAAEQPTTEKPVVEAPKDEPEKQKFVPHQALHEERRKRQEIESNFRQLQQNQAVLEQRYQQLWQAQQPQAKVPDKNEQPLEYFDHTLSQTQHELQQMREWHQSQANMQAQQQQAHNLATWARNEAQAFAADKPDFKGAYEHVLQLRAKEFQAMGVPTHEIAPRIAHYELGLFYQAHQAGRNPGEIVYEMARATGYSQKPVAADKVSQINKGMEASKTLGSGGVGGGMPTPEQILDMSEDEFAKFKADLSKKGKSLSDVM